MFYVFSSKQLQLKPNSRTKNIFYTYWTTSALSMLTNNQILNLLANPSQAETVVNISIFLPNVIRLQFIQHIFCQVIS